MKIGEQNVRVEWDVTEAADHPGQSYIIERIEGSAGETWIGPLDRPQWEGVLQARRRRIEALIGGAAVRQYLTYNEVIGESRQAPVFVLLDDEE